MELKELVGNHKLSGFDYGVHMKSGDISAIFVLDNVKYLVREDPDDGYRSMMRELEITNDIIYNVFSPIDVICKMQKNGDDILQIYDSTNNKLILEIGTDEYGDYYYPCFVCAWIPENISINKENNKNEK